MNTPINVSNIFNRFRQLSTIKGMTLMHTVYIFNKNVHLNCYTAFNQTKIQECLQYVKFISKDLILVININSYRIKFISISISTAKT